MTSHPFFAAAAPSPRPSVRDTRASRWGDELSRHRPLSLAAGAALTLTALAIALALTIDGITHLDSLVQLLLVSVLLVIGQAATLAAVLLRPAVLRVLGVAAAVLAVVLMNALGMGGLWIVPAATAAVLLLRRSPHSWRRLVSAGAVLIAAASLALWAAGLSGSALVRTPIFLASLLALVAGTLLLVNYLAGRDTWGSLLLGSAVTLGTGGVLGVMGSLLAASTAGEDSLTFSLFALGMLGMKNVDVLLPLIAVPVLALIAMVRLHGGSVEVSGRATEEVSPTVSAAALGLAVLTVLPALVGTLDGDAGAVADMLVGAVHLILWAACVGLWFTLHREVVRTRLPLTALSLDHVLVISLIVLSPLVKGVLAWSGFMIEGAPLHESL